MARWRDMEVREWTYEGRTCAQGGITSLPKPGGAGFERAAIAVFTDGQEPHETVVRAGDWYRGTVPTGRYVKLGPDGMPTGEARTAPVPGACG